LPLVRQFLLAFAIVLLMFFESSVALLTFAPNEPLAAWLWPVAFYASYLAAASLAFRRRT